MALRLSSRVGSLSLTNAATKACEASALTKVVAVITIMAPSSPLPVMRLIA